MNSLTLDRFPTNSARTMHARLYPLEIFSSGFWRPLLDRTIERLIRRLPETRAVDVANGIRLADGRIVRYCVPRLLPFDEVDLQRDHAGNVDCATAYCRQCRAYRLLAVRMTAQFTTLECEVCASTHEERFTRGTPL